MLTEHAEVSAVSRSSGGRWSKMLRLEWLGQTVASGCWIASVFTYGLNSAGDWLQLCAATAWFIANIAALGGEGGSATGLNSIPGQKR